MLNGNDEIWVDIQEFIGRYQVSNLGNVRSIIDNHGKEKCQLKVPYPCKKGYWYVQLFVKDAHYRDSTCAVSEPPA